MGISQSGIMKSLTLTLLIVFNLDQIFAVERTTALHDALLSGYSKDAKPDGQVQVKIGLSISSLDLCAHRQVLSSAAWTEMQWNDPRLAWDPQEFGGLSSIRINSKHIWVPDITCYNAVDVMKPITNGVEELTNVVIRSNGHVIYVPPMMIKTHCNVNYEGWPFGEQNCTWKFGSWTYDKTDIDITAGATEYDESEGTADTTDIIKLDHFVDNSMIEIIGSDYIREEKGYDCCPDETYPSLTLSLQFKNKAKFVDNVLMTP